jgi:hypothetical protein
LPSDTGDEVAQRRQQAEGRGQGCHAEQQRDACSDDGAEGDREDCQRDRERRVLGTAEVGLVGERKDRPDGVQRSRISSQFTNRRL